MIAHGLSRRCAGHAPAGIVAACCATGLSDLGLAVARARALGRDPERARSRATALAEILAAGRIVAAPAGLDPELAGCLEDHLYAAMADPEFVAAVEASGYTLQPARGTDAVRGMRGAEGEADGLVPIIERAVARLRS